MRILDDLIGSLRDDGPARVVRIGPFWTAVWSRACGLASTIMPEEHMHGATFVDGAGQLTARSTLELARLAYSDSTLEAGIGLAAINSLVDIDEERCEDLNAGQVLVEWGRGKRVALVGHFPFVPSLRETARELSVLELHPQADDFPAEKAETILPGADVVAITGSAFINHTFERLLGLCKPESFVIVLGPTTPLSTILLDHGVDVISGTRVVNPEVALGCLSEGATFRQMEGVRLLTMRRQGRTR